MSGADDSPPRDSTIIKTGYATYCLRGSEGGRVNTGLLAGTRQLEAALAGDPGDALMGADRYLISDSVRCAGFDSESVDFPSVKAYGQFGHCASRCGIFKASPSSIAGDRPANSGDYPAVTAADIATCHAPQYRADHRTDSGVAFGIDGYIAHGGDVPSA